MPRGDSSKNGRLALRPLLHCSFNSLLNFLLNFLLNSLFNSLFNSLLNSLLNSGVSLGDSIKRHNNRPASGRQSCRHMAKIFIDPAPGSTTALLA